MIKSNAGFITLDFVFAIIIAFGMTAILFSMTYTLSAVEIAQYLTFSSSRAHAAAHATPDKQIEMGQKKFNELLTQPVQVRNRRKPGQNLRQNNCDMMAGCVERSDTHHCRFAWNHGALSVTRTAKCCVVSIQFASWFCWQLSVAEQRLPVRMRANLSCELCGWFISSPGIAKRTLNTQPHWNTRFAIFGSGTAGNCRDRHFA